MPTYRYQGHTIRSESFLTPEELEQAFGPPQQAQESSIQEPSARDQQGEYDFFRTLAPAPAPELLQGLARELNPPMPQEVVKQSQDPTGMLIDALAALAGGGLGRLGRIGLGAVRGGKIAQRGIETALKTGEMIPADPVARGVQTAVGRGALTGAKQRAAEDALTSPLTTIAGGRLKVPIEELDRIRRIGGKLRGVNVGEGKMIVKGAKEGLEEADSPGARQLLQALSDFAIRKRLTSGFTSPLSLLDLLSAGFARPGRAVWRANQALRPGSGAELAGGVGGYGLSRELRDASIQR